MRKKRRIMEMAGLRHRSDLLLEEEEDDLFGGDDEEGEDEAADDEDAEEDAEEGDDDADEEEDPGRQLTAKEVEDLGPGDIEQELDSVMKDIFDNSAKSLAAKAVAQESIHKNPISSFLFESQDLDTFDMQRFASETARYINHYDTLLDVEGMLYNKAKETLLSMFGDQGDAAVTEFEDFMSRVHGLDLTGKDKEDFVAPVAAGAGGEGAA
tara:strand:- start:1587 stop:2219 length:633 start_codon:yes stop_codon:yes gene_type:complete